MITHGSDRTYSINLEAAKVEILVKCHSRKKFFSTRRGAEKAFSFLLEALKTKRDIKELLFQSKLEEKCLRQDFDFEDSFVFIK